jgi:stage III sporulation protein AD
VAVILATLIKKEKAEISLLIGISATVIIFLYVLSQIKVVISFVSGMIDMISLEETYYIQLLKMLGVAYVAEFASAICKDSGHNAISGMIELFAKLSIVALSIPGIVFLVETIGDFI